MSDTTRDPHAVAISAALAAPFDPREVKFKAQAVKNNRALVVAFIDARLVQDRLDEVLGTENWEDSYKILPDGSVVCKLRCKIGDRWVSKTDVGSPSEQPDVGDRMKAAFSDALKRAAVKFGIARYLYSLPASWCDYDPIKKQIVSPPQLPARALPAAAAPAPKAVPAPVPTAAPTEAGCRAKLNAARTLAELEAAWFATPQKIQGLVRDTKDLAKAALAKAPAASRN